jgi:DNA polymerase (family 10)
LPIHNSEIVEILNRTAELLDIEGANPFRVRAYRHAARTVGGLPRSVTAMLAEGGDLSHLPGIGKDLAHKIEVVVDTGHLPLLDEIEQRVPAGLARLLRVPGLGPKRVRALHEVLGVNDLDRLAKAAKSGKLRTLPGFSAKIEEKILHALETRGAEERRMKRAEAEQVAEPLVRHLMETRGIKQVSVAGSYRRKKETVGDLDILATCTKKSPVIEHFTAYEDVAEVIARGTTLSTVIPQHRGAQDGRGQGPQDQRVRCLQARTARHGADRGRGLRRGRPALH